MTDYSIEITATEEDGEVDVEATYQSNFRSIDTNIYAYYYNDREEVPMYGKPVWSSRVWFPTMNPVHRYLLKRNDEVDRSINIESNKKVSWRFFVAPSNENRKIAFYVADEEEPQDIIEV